MITPDYLGMMAAYNSEMNRRIYVAAASLTDEVRRADAGVFWLSLHGTLNHLLWADQMWLSRFTGSPKPSVGLKKSSGLFERFEDMSRQREQTDRDIERWAAGADQSWLDSDLTWFSGAAKRTVTLPTAKLVVHFFNHQTHHRGQVHGLLTRVGVHPGDTDLFLVV